MPSCYHSYYMGRNGRNQMLSTLRSQQEGDLLPSSIQRILKLDETPLKHSHPLPSKLLKHTGAVGCANYTTGPYHTINGVRIGCGWCHQLHLTTAAPLNKMQLVVAVALLSMAKSPLRTSGVLSSLVLRALGACGALGLRLYTDPNHVQLDDIHLVRI
ncbi:hypothetical protein NE237_025550 [Protea cynaroides]|uniref:Uncharacterized protein n=1 Tax=Protea cynaroides TaxID=273540 RepID=A0A9Q0H3C9_9MAGN|nr:hypothetical protein NE237_025550 [Protea cynaroides]